MKMSWIVVNGFRVTFFTNLLILSSSWSLSTFFYRYFFFLSLFLFPISFSWSLSLLPFSSLSEMEEICSSRLSFLLLRHQYFLEGGSLRMEKGIQGEETCEKKMHLEEARRKREGSTMEERRKNDEATIWLFKWKREVDTNQSEYFG